MRNSQSTLWIIAAVLMIAAAILGATSGEAIIAIVFGLAAVAFVIAAFRPQARGTQQPH